jgi:hypothetical protein
VQHIAGGWAEIIRNGLVLVPRACPATSRQRRGEEYATAAEQHERGAYDESLAEGAAFDCGGAHVER